MLPDNCRLDAEALQLPTAPDPGISLRSPAELPGPTGSPGTRGGTAPGPLPARRSPCPRCREPPCRAGLRQEPLSGRTRAEPRHPLGHKPFRSPMTACPMGRGGGATVPRYRSGAARRSGAGSEPRFCFPHFPARRRPALSLPVPPAPGAPAPSRPGFSPHHPRDSMRPREPQLFGPAGFRQRRRGGKEHRERSWRENEFPWEDAKRFARSGVPLAR